MTDKHRKTNHILRLTIFLSIIYLALTCSEHCVDCTPDNSICFACDNGYELSVFGKCVLQTTVTKCILYGPNDACFACQPTFILSAEKCQIDYTACINQNPSDSTCYECGFSTILENNKCTGIINCQLPGKTCSKCKNGFSLQNGKCSPAQGCTKFDQIIGVCKECDKNYQMVGYNCISKQKISYNCYIYNEKEECQSCKNGFIMFQNQCLIPSDITAIQVKIKTTQQVRQQQKQAYDAYYSSITPVVNTSPSNCQVPNPQTPSQCLICNYGWYPSANLGTQCILVSPFCDGHDVSNGKCFKCKFSTLQLKDGKCLDSNCLTTKIDGTCNDCKTGFSKDTNAVCMIDDKNCQTKNGTICTQCKSNYKINMQGICQQIPVTLTIVNCKVVDQTNKICAVCQDRYYRSGSQCLLVNSNCKDYDMSNGKCKSCINGLILNNQQCIKQAVTTNTSNTTTSTPNNYNSSNTTTSNTSTITTTTTGGGAINLPSSTSTKDQNCLKKDLSNNKCLQCSKRFYVGPVEGKCIPVNPLCDGYNQSGACTSCFKGYKTNGVICAVAQQRDPNCQKSDDNGICLNCSQGFFVNTKNTCEPVNPLCKSSDPKTGKCTDCYTGYTLTDGTCKVFMRDPNCQQYDSNTNCIKCPNKFFIFQGICKQVSPLCFDYDKVTGLCTKCYPGYVLNVGVCGVATALNDDIHCSSREATVCTGCYQGYYLNSISKKCTSQNLLCKQLDLSNGACTSCYKGYILLGGQCNIATDQTSDLNCKGFDSTNKKCIQCYKGYVIIISTGLCTAIDPLCKTSDQNTGQCTTCYSGYTLKQGTCLLDNGMINSDGIVDGYCIKVQNGKCTDCNKGYFIASNGICTQVDATCKTYSSQNGYCTTCYTGFVLSGNRCIVGQQLYIPFCKQSNSVGICVQCIDRYYLKDAVCSPVSLLCDTYSKLTGKCTTCNPGYVLQNQDCIFPALGVDPACTNYVNSYCGQCKLGFYLLNYVCSQIDSKCLEFDYQKSLCTKCSNNLTSQGSGCQ